MDKTGFQEKSDLAQLWEDAVREYEQRTKQSLNLGQITTVNGVMQSTDSLGKGFGDFRHDRGKVDKVRTVFKNNMWLINKVVGAFQMVGAAVSAFPPAMPAALIFVAFNQVMQSFANQSADYDRIVGFYEFTHRFLDRLSMIQDRNSGLPQLQRCISRVFSSMLSICAIAQEYSTGKNRRLKKWLDTLVDGSDANLAAAYQTMEDAVNELSQAVGLATFKKVDIIAGVVASIEQKMDFVVSSVTTLDERTGEMQTDLSITSRNTERIIVQGNAAVERDAVMRKENAEGNALLLKEFKDLKAQITSKQSDGLQDKERERIKTSGKKSKTDPAEKRRSALSKLKGRLIAQVIDWESVMKDTKEQSREIKDLMTAGTGQWLLKNEAQYTSWVDHEGSSILWLRGAAGVGKTFLAHTVATELEGTSKDKTSAAHFFFRESQQSLGTWQQALSCLAFQIAEKDSRYSEQLAGELSDTTNEPNWTVLFEDKFPGKESSHVFLVLDGIDELKKDEQDMLCASLGEIAQKNLNVHVLLASRPNVPQIEALSPAIIDVTPEKLATDFSKVLHAGCRTLPRLKKFRKTTRIAITRKLKAQADSMRYIEHMLRRLSYIGRENAVLQDLESKLPDNLTALYALMLEECQRGRTDKQYRALKKLFAWIAYSARSLTLSEASKLAKLTVADDNAFDIEDELIGRSARILELSADIYEEEDIDEEKSDDSDELEEDAEEEPDSEGHGSSEITFQERSLREYFQAIDVDEHGLRTPPSTAHLTIFDMAASLLFEDGDHPNGGRESDLRDYAASYWVHHLVEIDLDAVKDDEVVHVILVLHKILSNYNNTARSMEEFSSDTYSEYLNGHTPLLERLKLWVDRALKLSDDALPAEVQAWARDFTTSGALLTLAHGHVANWFKEFNGPKNFTIFRFARDALAACNVDVAEDSPETILKIANYFQDIPQTAGTMRAISATLSWYDMSEPALEYARKGIEMLDGGASPLLFYLTRSTSLSLAELGKYEEAVSAVETAVSAPPPEWKKDADLAISVKCIYGEKATYLKALNRVDDAVEVYNELRALDPEKPFDGDTLDNIALLADWDSDPSGEKLYSILKSWTEKERLSYFDYNFSLSDDYTTERLNRVASLPGDEPRALVLQCYNAYMESLTQSPGRLMFTRAALAALYKDAWYEPAKAKELYTQVLKTDVRHYDVEVQSYFLSEIRRTVGELIFFEFQRTNKPAQKQALLDEFKEMTKNTAEPEEASSDASNLDVMLALMTRVLKPGTEYQEAMQKAFDSCFGMLSDTVGWNDSSAFRLLAKLLACVKGLERDALIAVSSQFSKVTEEPEEPEDATSSESEGSASSEAEEQAESNDAEKTEPSGETKIPEVQIHSAETTISSTTVQDGVLTDKTKVIIEEAVVTHEDMTGNASTTDAEAEATDGEAAPAEPDPHALPPIEDEDIAQGAGIFCNGDCGNAWEKWDVPIGLCVLCENCDLCIPCYEKLAQLAEGEPVKYCGRNHRYIRGPIKGWQGVKDGSIRIRDDEGNVEATPMRDWLKTLKEERWPRAWEEFWVDMSGVRDIGM